MNHPKRQRELALTESVGSRVVTGTYSRRSPILKVSENSTDVESCFAGRGEAARILRTIDWDARPVGPVAEWPQSLRTALNICLSSRYPICILWGPERTYFYNDAYTPIVGDKHPSALGDLYPNVWPEIWEPVIKPILEEVERTGEASWCDNILLVLRRYGFNEECYFAFSFAPIRLENGMVGGVFTAITETTRQLVGERRLRTLKDLATRAPDAKSADEACRVANEVLASNPHDVPFSLFYLIEPDGSGARLVHAHGTDGNRSISPKYVSLAEGNGQEEPWPFSEVVRTGEPITLRDIGSRYGPLPGGPWEDETHTALVVPIARPGQTIPYGFFVAGVSPRRTLDADYESFLSLVASQVATAISNARAYEEERARAEALAENVSHEFRTPLTLKPTTLTSRAFVEEALRWLPDAAGSASGLPVLKPAVEVDSSERAHTDRSSRTARILVADDNADMRDYVRRLLTGYEVITVPDGEAALANAQRTRPDLILTDIMMPRLDGFGLLQAVRADAHLKTIPVILLSARAGEESHVEGLDAGADDYLIKPFSARELIVRVESHLKMARFRQEAFSTEQMLREEVSAQRQKAEDILQSISDGFFALDAEWRFTYLNPSAESLLRKSAAELLGKNHWDEYPATIGTIVEREFRRARSSRASVQFESFYAPWRCWFEIKAYPWAQGLAVHFRDVTDRKKAADDLTAPHRRLAEQVEGLTRLHQLSTRLMNTRETAPMLFSILESIVALHGTDKGLLLLADENGRFLHVGASLGFDPADLEKLKDVAAGTGACGAAFAERRRVIVEDTEVNALFESCRDFARAAGFRAVHSTPILARNGRALGVLSVHFPVPSTPSEVQIQLADMYARQAADFMEQAETDRALRKRDSELRETTRALQLSEERFRLAAFSEAITLYEQDSQLRYVWLYPVHPEHEEALGKSDRELLQNEQGANLERWKREVMSTGQPQRRETRTDLPSGPRVYDLFILPRRNSAGEIIGVAGTALDITARKEAEAALRESEARMRTLAESLPNLVWTCRPDGSCDWLSSQWRDYTGIPEEELLGLEWLGRVIHPDDREKTLACWTRACRGDGEYDLEYRIRRSDGQYHWFKTRGVPMREESGKIVYWFGTCTDIEDMQQAELAVQRLAAIVEHSDDAILSIDLESMIQSWNRGAERLYGYSRAEVIGKHVTMLIPDSCGDQHQMIMDRILTGQSIKNCETQRRRKDGTLFDVSLTVSPVKDRDGNIVGVSKVARDITEKLRAKEKLEQTVLERTASLREVIAQLEEFSYSVSHDLRSPVRAMQGYAKALAEDFGDQLGDEARKYLDRIIQGTGRMERLIHDVLTYSRVNRMEMNLQAVSLAELLRDIVAEYPELSSGKADIIISPDLPAVIAHEPALGQALANLLNNAVKFVAPGTRPRVDVSSERIDGYVMLRIKDNGIGIKPEHQGRLFGMFERIHPEGMYEGTGIGLAIVRKTIERMGGRVGVLSDGVNGSIFWVQLRATDGI